MNMALGWLSRPWVRVVLMSAALLAVAGVYAAKTGNHLAEPASAATVDYFLKLDGIDGESADKNHKNEIDLESFSWGDGHPGLQQTGNVGGGGGAGKVSVHDIHFKMNTSKASPKLMETCASGKHIKEAVLTVRKSGEKPQEFLKITLTDVLVSSYQVGGGGSSSLPTDQISLNFGKLKMEYVLQNADGSLEAAIEGLVGGSLAQ
jgi:type VI secretion system secreted protein Hcp